MRAITGTIVSSDPCSVKMAGAILSRFAESTTSHLPSSDYATYLRTAADAAKEHRRFLRFLAANCQQGAAYLDADGYEGAVEGEREPGGGEENWGAEVPAGGPHISAEEVKVAVAADEKKSKKRKMKEDPHEDKAVAGVAPHASVEITSEQRKKKEKHSNKELPSLVIVKQEPDLVVEEELVGERKKKKQKHSHKELTSSVKQEPDLVVEEELGSEKKKGKKKKEKGHVKSEEDVVEVQGQIVNNGVAEQGILDEGKKRKKKRHSEEKGESKGVKEEEIMSTAIVLYSEKKKKKRVRVDDDDNGVRTVCFWRRERRELIKDGGDAAAKKVRIGELAAGAKGMVAGEEVGGGSTRGNGVAEIDEGLHSRQLAVYGRETMRRLFASNVLVSGLNGLGAEIAKNLALAGVQSVTLHDEGNVEMWDLSGNFFLTEDDIGKNRAVACVAKLQELNNSVLISALTDELTIGHLSKFQL
ncbi:hypothetical protein EJB05_07005, partial [Eragrostis curvula]